MSSSGIVKLLKCSTKLTLCEVEEELSLGRRLTYRHTSPGLKGPLPKQSVVDSFHQVSADPKEIVDGTVDGEEALHVS